MTADNGRRGLAWYDRRQPTILAETARRAGLRSTPRVGEYVDVLDAAGYSVACARFTRRGMFVRAWGITTDRKRLDWQVSGFGTPREILDEFTAWLAAGRPPAPSGHSTAPVTTTPEREHLAEVLPFRPRKHS